MEPLKVVLLVYFSVLVINGLFSAVCFYYYRENLYKKAIVLWAAIAVNFSLQGVFTQTPLTMVLSFSTYFVCSIVLVKILVEMTSLTLPFRRYYILMAFGEACVVGLALAKQPFWVVAAPASLGIAYPMLDGALKSFSKNNRSKATRIFGGLLLVNAIHYLDYPFLRLNAGSALFGFSFALALLFAVSFFLPAFIVKKLSDRYAGQLENDVRTRTQKLQEANEKLIEVTAENKYLLSLVCHDIASPLHIITHFTQVLTRQSAEPEMTPFISTSLALQKMARASRFISETLDHVRKLHALREGKVKFDLREIDLAQVIEEVRFLHETDLTTKNIKLIFNDQLPKGVKILGDPNSLRNNVINNLLSNAIKFSHPNSEIEITVVAENQHIKLQISDHGVGIPPEALPKIFDAQAPTSRDGTSGEKGTGFGLPIVKTSLNHFDAQIRVESVTESEDPLHHGTSFFIYFRGTNSAVLTAS